MQFQELEKIVLERLSKSFDQSRDQITFIDQDGAGRHFQLSITSEKFQEVSRLNRSRMVFELLNDLIQNDTIHGLQLILKTADESGT